MSSAVSVTDLPSAEAWREAVGCGERLLELQVAGFGLQLDVCDGNKSHFRRL